MYPNNATSRIHARQIRAFMNASEDVSIDRETIQDILDGFTPDSEGRYIIETLDEDDEDDEEEFSDDELDISALYIKKKDGKHL
jgi:hypothetical protein